MLWNNIRVSGYARKEIKVLKTSCIKKYSRFSWEQNS